MSKIDLHLHSIYSDDGELTPEALVALAKEAGVSTMAVADHNTTSGVAKAVCAGCAAGVEVIPAVELDCQLQNINFHVLGYGIDPAYPPLQAIEQDVKAQEKAAARQRIRLVNEAGIPLDEAEALARAKDGLFVTGELIAEIVLAKPGAASNPLLQPYFAGGARCDNPYVNFYWDYCSQGKPAYVPITFISMQRAIAVIHQAGGVAVLAHPGQNLRGHLQLLPAILALGMDGMECYSSYHDAATCLYYAQKAAGQGLLVTGGSDYHGKTKPAIRMGQFGLAGDGLDMLAALKTAIAARQATPTPLPK